MKLAAPACDLANSYALGLRRLTNSTRCSSTSWAHLEGIVRNADATTIGSALEDLETLYTVLHFTEEETFMRSIRYPNFDAIAERHRRFVQRVAEKRPRHKAVSGSPGVAALPA